MRNLIILTLAGLIAVAAAGAFILKGDVIMAEVERLVAGPPDPEPAKPDPTPQPVKVEPEKVRALVYTRSFQPGHVVAKGRDISFQRVREAAIPGRALTSPDATDDPLPYAKADRRPLQIPVQAGDPVSMDHLGDKIVDKTPEWRSDPGYLAATNYIDRLRRMLERSEVIFLTRDNLDPAGVAARMRFDRATTGYDGRITEGGFVGADVAVVARTDTGADRTLADDVTLKRVSFNDTVCGEAQYYVEIPERAGDEVALARACGENDRIRLRITGAGEKAEEDAVCAGGTCTNPNAEAPTAASKDEDAKTTPTGEGDGEGGAGDDAPATGTPVDEADDFALGKERTDRAPTAAQERYCDQGNLVDPRERETRR